MNKERYWQEIKAGTTGFLTCVYIVVVTPNLFSATGAEPAAIMTATVLVSLFGALGMGLYANAPFFLAPGLGMNVFFTYTMVVGMNIPLETALGMVFLSGVLLIILSFFGIRERLVALIPDSIGWAVAGGIGIFIAFVGLKNVGMVTAHPSTLVGMGPWTPHCTVFVLGLIMGAIFLQRKSPLGFLPGILITTFLAATLGRWWGGDVPLVIYKGFFSAPDFSLFFQLDVLSVFRSIHIYWIPLLTLFLINLTDTLSSYVGVSRAGGLNRDEPQKSFIVDAITTTFAGIFGTSPTTYLIESATGIEQGGRTGVTALTMGALLFPLLFFSPLLSMIPPLSTAPTLVLTGVLMASCIGQISWNRFEQAFPAFMVLVLTPLTFSISTGLWGGLLAYSVCRLFKKL